VRRSLIYRYRLVYVVVLDCVYRALLITDYILYGYAYIIYLLPKKFKPDSSPIDSSRLKDEPDI